MLWKAGNISYSVCIFVVVRFVELLIGRLQAIATPLVPNMEKVQIRPPPKEVDPRVLAWKGAAVLGKMDSVSELWVSPSDWVRHLSLRRTSVGSGLPTTSPQQVPVSF